MLAGVIHPGFFLCAGVAALLLLGLAWLVSEGREDRDT
jgi:hypothetical protein